MIPGPMAAQDRLLAELRENSGHRIYRSPWGWTAYKPGRAEEIQAPTLEELAEKLAHPE